ncbi:hypothetical protein [Actinocrispum wychmicini]|uniref:Lumazine-binding protein n=1 Tax=Actinocrispum wychmicini TaxID=1213861 RepID=A0A4R2JA14_9PSEU|nr:hypothetical protein [Actinocrispum wychmicini]TCO53526.1 hypothetical protein EV192_110115 [Actinocrispum wychmicini]
MTTEDSRRRNGRILVIVAAALIVIVGGVGILLLTRGDGGTDDPNRAAQSFVDVYQRGLNSSGRDVSASDFAPFVCAADMDGIKEAFSVKENPVDGEPRFRMSVKDVKTDGDKGSFTVVSQISAPGTQPTSEDENYSLVKESGSWRVCGLGA